MEQPIQAKFRLTEEQFLAGTLAVMASELKYFKFIRGMGGFLLLTALFKFFSSLYYVSVFPDARLDISGILWALLMGATGTGMLFPKQSLRFLLRNKFRSSTRLGMEIAWSISDEGTTQASEVLSTRETWAAYRKVVRTSAGFLFFSQQGIANWLPFSAFASCEEIEAASKIIAANAKTYSVLNS